MVETLLQAPAACASRRIDLRHRASLGAMTVATYFGALFSLPSAMHRNLVILGAAKDLTDRSQTALKP
jgi:hypothetical protein